MADYPSIKSPIQTEQVQTRKPVSELLMQNLGGSVNFLLTNYIPFYKFPANGRYASGAGKESVDGPFISPFDGEIVDAVIYSSLSGASGTTSLDILRSTDGGVTWTSIFTTVPAVDSSAASNSFCRTTQTATGYTPGVLISNPLPFNNGDAFRMDIGSVQVGAPYNTGIILFFKPRNS